MRALLALLLWLPLSLSAQTLTLAVDPWPPFTEKAGKGIATSIVREVLLRGGIKLKTLDVPWTEAWEGSVAGRYDGVLAVWRDDERARALLFSDPYMLNRVVMVTRRKDGLILLSLDDLAGRNVGVVTGYEYHPDFDARHDFNRVEGASLSVSMRNLWQGKADIVVDSELAIERWLRANPKSAKQLLIQRQALAERGLYLAINPHTPKAEALINNFNMALKAMQADGSLRLLVQKHRQQ